MDPLLQTATRPAIATACLNCRDKHLKCDGNPEGCGRCRDLALFCHFVPSRRGRRGQPYRDPWLDELVSPLPEGDVVSDALLNVVPSTDVSPNYAPASQGAPPQISTHLVKTFFEYFHPAHPILPPFDLWVMSSPPQYLISIVEFIGLHHLSPGQVPECSSDLWATIGNADLSLEKTQAYLLLSILYHGRKAPEYATKCIGLAIHCSVGLELHRRELSDVEELQNPSRAESMRRTLWEIFIVDTLLATVQVGGTLQFKMEIPDVPLPATDESFVHDFSRLSSVSAKDLSRRALLCEDDCLSCLAYRIEATLILRQCIISCESVASEDTLEALDATMSAWFHRWPSSNSAILQPNGRVNQIDLQTAMVMHCASIYLHFPKSCLVSLLPHTSELFCSRPPPFSAHSSKPQMHTAKIVNAAVELSKLASLSTYVTGHSPFFACTLVLSSIIQVAVLTAPVGQPVAMHYSYLALNIGVLKSMGNTWDIAASSLMRLRAIVREVEKASTEAGYGQVEPFSSPPVLQS